ncbi:hypothetical protein HYC85_004294 [Camellia sinensis]|uniref:Uncharacterized protein n=1 Tax=Camellia sinensis TaxID=4442 RepID=A0A7J7HWQ9_CAMSI|nr:hypothetical protein HYC85_004294 [Camellia sinensis]
MAWLSGIAEPFPFLYDNGPGKTNKETTLFNEQKEREGFEPSIVLCSELYRFSRPGLSTTQPSLRKTIHFYFILPNRT